MGGEQDKNGIAKLSDEWESISNILSAETDIHLLAQCLSNFFKQLFRVTRDAKQKKHTHCDLS